MLEKLTHSDFEKLENKIFEIDLGEAGKVSATLEKTAGFNLESEEGLRDSFSIFLRFAAPPVQQIYRVTHAELGALDLFLVPIEENENGGLFEAVFT